jgi:hypothetical protein
MRIMKRKVLAGLILTGVICFSGTAFAAKIIAPPKNSGQNPPPPQEWNGQPPVKHNGNNNVRPQVTPNNNGSNNVRPPMPPNSNGNNNVRPQVTPNHNGNKSVRPPKLPEGNGNINQVRPPKQDLPDVKPPENFKPREIKRPPQLKR